MTRRPPDPPTPRRPRRRDEPSLPRWYILTTTAGAYVAGLAAGAWETLHGHSPQGYGFAVFLVLMGFGLHRLASAFWRRP